MKTRMIMSAILLLISALFIFGATRTFLPVSDFIFNGKISDSRITGFSKEDLKKLPPDQKQFDISYIYFNDSGEEFSTQMTVDRKILKKLADVQYSVIYVAHTPSRSLPEILVNRTSNKAMLLLFAGLIACISGILLQTKRRG